MAAPARKAHPPAVSVIIPAYNQAQYLAAAINSVLGQTVRDFEIIVVDDGSTDATPAVAAEFGSAIRCVRQPNKGLAAARNTGLRAAQAEFVGFLDSDDEWRPAFLESMLALAARNPQAAACYCAAVCVDEAGRELPQAAGARQVEPDAMYQTLLRANFLIPSTVLARRSAVEAAGLFDESQRVMDGCADWDLWLRLARTQALVGTPECLACYRLHGASLSADVAGMQRAAAAVMLKHFGPDDGRPQTWSADKRRGYGGLYRHSALTVLARQGDWGASANDLRRALAADPALAADLDLFYELALGTQPLGYRGTPHKLRLAHNAAQLRQALEQVFPPAPGRAANAERRAVIGMAYYGLGLAAYNTGDPAACRRFWIKALRFRPGLWRERRFALTLAKAALGRRLLDTLRRRRAPA